MRRLPSREKRDVLMGLGLASLATGLLDPRKSVRQQAQMVDFLMRRAMFRRPHSASAVHPDRRHRGAMRAFDVVVGLIAHMHGSLCRHAGALQRSFEHSRIRLAGAGVRWRERELEVMRDAGPHQIRVAVGQADQTVVLCEFAQNLVHLGEKRDLAAGLHESVHALQSQMGVIAVFFKQSAESGPPQRREIVAQGGVLLRHGPTVGLQILDGVACGDPRRVGADPGVLHLLRTREHWACIPKGVVKVERDESDHRKSPWPADGREGASITQPEGERGG